MLKEMPVACEPDDTLVTDVTEPLFRLEDLYKTFPNVSNIVRAGILTLKIGQMATIVN